MSKLPSRTYGGTPVSMPRPPAPGNTGFGNSLPNGGKAAPRTYASLASGIDAGRPVKSPKLPAAPPAIPHMSPAVRKDLGKLNPDLRKGLLDVADRRRPS